MDETGHIHPAGDVRHILPEPGNQGCKVHVLLKITEKNAKKKKSTLFSSFIILQYCTAI